MYNCSCISESILCAVHAYCFSVVQEQMLDVHAYCPSVLLKRKSKYTPPPTHAYTLLCLHRCMSANWISLEDITFRFKQSTPAPLHKVRSCMCTFMRIYPFTYRIRKALSEKLYCQVRFYTYEELW